MIAGAPKPAGRRSKGWWRRQDEDNRWRRRRSGL